MASVVFFEVDASRGQKYTQRELEYFELGIAPANKKCQVVSLPGNAPAPVENVNEEDVFLKSAYKRLSALLAEKHTIC